MTGGAARALTQSTLRPDDAEAPSGSRSPPDGGRIAGLPYPPPRRIVGSGPGSKPPVVPAPSFDGESKVAIASAVPAPHLDSRHVEWHRRAGLFLAVRYLRRNRVPVHSEPLARLPRLSRNAIRLALRLFPRFLDRADLRFPIIIAGRGWSQIALDGRHRLSRAIWTGADRLLVVRVPWWYCLELLVPGVYEVEWLFLFLRKELRRVGRVLVHAPPHPPAGPHGR